MKKTFMQFMRHISLTVVLTLSVFSMVTYTACSKKDSASPTQAYAGTYKVTEACNPSLSSSGGFTDIVTQSGTSNNEIVFSNIGGSNEPITGTVSGNNVTLSATTFTTQYGSITVTGSGTLTGSILTVTFNIAGAVSAACTDVMTKQ